MKQNTTRQTILISMLFAFPMGCASPFALEVDGPRARPTSALTADYPIYRAPAAPGAAMSGTDGPALTSVITLGDALQAALASNPDIVAGAWQTRIEEVRGLTAALRPNPEIGIEFENFAGSGDFSGTDSMQTTLQIGQLIELGDDRQRRMDVAGRSWDVAAWAYEVKRVSVATETARRFVNVLGAQRQLELSERSAELANESFQLMKRRAELGDASTIDLLKSRTLYESRAIETEHQRHELDAARRLLAAMWGAREPLYDSVSGDFDQLIEVPRLDVLHESVVDHPEVRRWAAEVRRRQADIALQRAAGRADMTISGGPRFDNRSDDVAAVIMFSIPLQIHDANQGGILEARLAVHEAVDEQRATEARLRADLERAYSQMSYARHEVDAIRDTLLPTAEAAHDATMTAYRTGELEYLEVLDAQRTLFEIESHLLEALANYHAAVIDVEGLIARPLDAPATKPTEEGHHP